MGVKLITLFYLTCCLLNIGHIYQISDKYLRYDVTTNVRISMPEEIEIPSLTLCIHLLDTVKWETMSSDLRRKILSSVFFDSNLSEFDKDPSRVFSEVEEISQDTEKIYLIYNNLVKNRTVSQLLKLTASFQEIFEFFVTTGLLGLSVPGSACWKNKKKRRDTCC